LITTNLSTLKIHKLTQAQYDREVANGTIDENALYLTPDEDNSAESLGNVSRQGDTMEGILVAQNNTSYTVKQMRNIFLVAEGEELPAGSNGDICLVYVP
jgi:hypothetical protein